MSAQGTRHEERIKGKTKRAAEFGNRPNDHELTLVQGSTNGVKQCAAWIGRRIGDFLRTDPEWRSASRCGHQIKTKERVGSIVHREQREGRGDGISWLSKDKKG